MSLFLEELKTRKIYNLEQPRFVGHPAYPSHKPLYNYFLSRRHSDNYFPEKKGPRTTAQGFMIMGDHAGTHIDALCHQALDLTMYGGIKVDRTIETPTGYKELSVEKLPPIIARCILLDVASYKGTDVLPERYSITAMDLENTAKSQHVQIGQGDAILVRTGYDTYWRQPEKFMNYAGVGADGSQWVMQFSPCVFGIDQLSWDLPEEIDPLTKSTHWAHIYLMVQNGITMIENMKLDELSRDHQYEFTLLCYPMKFEGATGSPVVPLAIV